MFPATRLPHRCHSHLSNGRSAPNLNPTRHLGPNGKTAAISVDGVRKHIDAISGIKFTETRRIRTHVDRQQCEAHSQLQFEQFLMPHLLVLRNFRGDWRVQRWRKTRMICTKNVDFRRRDRTELAQTNSAYLNTSPSLILLLISLRHL